MRARPAMRGAFVCAAGAAPNIPRITHMRKQKTFTPRPGDIDRAWWLVDATDYPLGRLASEIAVVLRGKHKATFAQHMDMGDYVVVVNAEKIGLTGAKREQKKYYRHSGYPGGLYERTAEEMLETQPEAVIEKAVKGMLPSNRLGRAMAGKLKVYAGPEHPHAGQNPQPMELVSRKVEA
jgi:large subunit ribosomal protein L13